MSRRSSLLLAIMLAPALAATVAAAPAFAAPAKHAHHVTRHTAQKKAPRKAPKKAPKKAQPHKKPGKPAALTCRAAMSKGRPYQFTTTDVIVTTAGGALVQATAHYLTTSVPEAAMASKQGVARIPYYISWSTPWYRVNVNVQVSQGSRTASCSTSFTPRLV
ncbi:MAG TPA: hypothetical protein VN969_39260 [Streptosporangiaceae bacterium]|nr:hypothetical protein [Streptosporangiaceae bacterium]